MTTAYEAPLGDFQVQFEHIVPAITGRTAPMGFSDVLEGFGNVCAQAIAPLNAIGDTEGCRWEAGRVITPSGFPDAFSLMREGGWLDLDGVPAMIEFCIDEMLAAANFAFSNYVGPTKRVAQLIEISGLNSAPQILADLRTGLATGALCLTEAQCGSDLGLINTRASVDPVSGCMEVFGEKIFVTSGAHDLCSAAHYLVLARPPRAPSGVRGLTLYLVSSSFGADAANRNSVSCVGIEHKLGLHGSATCTLRFEGANAWQIGEIGEGLRHLFPVMERERLVAALQAVGVSERALQAARAYAHTRLQGRSIGGVGEQRAVADPIIDHPDVRRMVLTMRAYTEGLRTLLLWVASEMDNKDPGAVDFVRLMTPLLKGFASDIASEVTGLAIQVLGGHGYIHGNGVEQYYRDARVISLHGGANGIQALDLLVRKIGGSDGEILEHFISRAEAALGRMANSGFQTDSFGLIIDALVRLRAITGEILKDARSDPHLLPACSYNYLLLLGHVALGFAWVTTASVAKFELARDSQGPLASVLRAKLNTATFHMAHLFPHTDRLFSSILSGAVGIADYCEAGS